MKSCSYCGKEYPDDVTNCSIDGESLRDNNPQPPISDDLIVKAFPDKNAPYLTFPDYRWSARDAWKCIGIFLVFEIILEMFISVLDWHCPGFFDWHKSGFGYFSTRFLHFLIFVLTAAYFARTETLATFWKGFGLDRKPNDYVWTGIVLALMLRFLGHFIRIHGWSKGVSNYEVNAFKQTFDSERYFFLLPLLLLAPLFEESVNRGFLYKAFRGSYSIQVSMALIVAWTAFTHWSQYHHSWVAALDLSILTIVQCYLREKSDSLWDCILCHLTFNASSFFVGGILH